VTACEVAVEAVITTPATYARVGVDIVGNVVHLSYESKNSAGELVRDHAQCRFTNIDGMFHMTGLFVNGQNLGPEMLDATLGPRWQAAGVNQIPPITTTVVP
jgi:hypothetical protein